MIWRVIWCVPGGGQLAREIRYTELVKPAEFPQSPTPDSPKPGSTLCKKRFLTFHPKCSCITYSSLSTSVSSAGFKIFDHIVNIPCFCDPCSS